MSCRCSKIVAVKLFLLLSLTWWFSPIVQASVPTVNGLSLYDKPVLPINFTHFPYVNPDAPKGGTFVRSVVGNFDSTNPMIITGTAVRGVSYLRTSLVYESLLTENLDEPFSSYGQLASGIRLDPARRWIEFDINTHARFSDGVPVTAEDVKFSFELLREKGLPLYRSYYADVTGVTIPQPDTVRFELAEQNSRELPLILGQFPILPAHIWRQRDFTRPTLDIPIGSGPYTVESIKPGSRIVYQRNLNYWGRDLPVNRGRYNANKIIYDYYRDESVSLEAFLAGLVDYRLETSSSRWVNDYRGPAINRGEIKKITLKRGSPSPLQAWVMNLRKPLFQDKRVRQALIMAFDFDSTNRLFFNNLYLPAKGFFDESEMGASGKADGKELELLRPFAQQLPSGIMTTTLSDTTQLSRRQRLEQASGLLYDAGYRVKNQRLVDASGHPFSFELLLSDRGLQRVALAYVGTLKRLGINAYINVIDPAQYQIRLQHHDFDMIYDAFGQSNSPGNEQRYYWTSAYADVPESNNSPGIKNAVVDALVETLIRAQTREDLVASTRALDRVLRINAWVVPLFHSAGYNLAFWNKLKQPAVTPHYGIDLDAWWIDPASIKNNSAQGEY